jgi:hypothetical protein
MSSYCRSQIGLAAQLVGAGYLVWVAFRGRQIFRRLEPTYGDIGAVLDATIKTQRTQFGHQLLAFALLAGGMVAQLIANWMAA